MPMTPLFIIHQKLSIEWLTQHLGELVNKGYRTIALPIDPHCTVEDHILRIETVAKNSRQILSEIALDKKLHTIEHTILSMLKHFARDRGVSIPEKCENNCSELLEHLAKRFPKANLKVQVAVKQQQLTTKQESEKAEHTQLAEQAEALVSLLKKMKKLNISLLGLNLPKSITVINNYSLPLIQEPEMYALTKILKSAKFHEGAVIYLDNFDTISLIVNHEDKTINKQLGNFSFLRLFSKSVIPTSHKEIQKEATTLEIIRIKNLSFKLTDIEITDPLTTDSQNFLDTLPSHTDKNSSPSNPPEIKIETTAPQL